MLTICRITGHFSLFMTRRGKSAGALLLALGVLTGCSRMELSSTPPSDISPASLRLWFSPLPAAPQPTTPEEKTQVALGRQLYFDTRLSREHNQSCNSCHVLTNYGVDNHRYSPGSIPGVLDTPRNTPTVYNAAFQFAQFWDGRAANLQQQAQGPMVASGEMALHSTADAVNAVRAVPEYVSEMKQAFPGQQDPVTIGNITAAIARFEEGLITPSNWDRYLQGDTAALTARQKQGLQLFLSYGCNTCHAGRDLGGISYQRLGDVYPWMNKSDPGREKVTHSPSDFMFFKVPSLRNIAKTGPYFQDGSVTSLTDAIRLMGDFQSGQPMSRHNAELIADFLNSATGTLPASYIAAPAEPPAGRQASAGMQSGLRGGR